jgi:hypothetical protein
MVHAMMSFWNAMCHPYNSIAMMLFDYFLVNGILTGLRCIGSDAWIARIAQYSVGVIMSLLCLGCFWMLLWLGDRPEVDNFFVNLGCVAIGVGLFFAGFSFLLGHAVGLWGSWMQNDYEVGNF